VLAVIALGVVCRLALDASAHVGLRDHAPVGTSHLARQAHAGLRAPAHAGTSHLAVHTRGARDEAQAARDDPDPTPTGGTGVGDESDDTSDAHDVDADALGLRPRNAPTVAETIAAAYRAAGLDRDLTRSLVRRARVAGVVPWLTVRVGRDANWQTDDPAIDRRMAFEVRATWRLDRLVFDGRELQVASIEAARRRERRVLASRVIRAYFSWRRATARAGGHVATRSQSLQAAAELDALTDGWFSETLGGKRRTASENRTP
jgi:hypothetical protein